MRSHCYIKRRRQRRNKAKRQPEIGSPPTPAAVSSFLFASPLFAEMRIRVLVFECPRVFMPFGGWAEIRGFTYTYMAQPKTSLAQTHHTNSQMMR